MFPVKEWFGNNTAFFMSSTFHMCYGTLDKYTDDDIHLQVSTVFPQTKAYRSPKLKCP